MTIIDNEVEEVLKGLLQKDIKLVINNKQYRKGKFLLFKQNNYYIEFTVKRSNSDIKRFEIPIPFAVEQWKEDGLIYFDYRLSTLSNNDNKIHQMLKKLPAKGNNKFCNKILEIQIIEEENNV